MAGEWTITEDATTAMQTAEGVLGDGLENVGKALQVLKQAYDENADGCGHHSEKIRGLIDDVEGEIASASDPVKKLILKLAKARMIRTAHRENNGYSKKR